MGTTHSIKYSNIFFFSTLSIDTFALVFRRQLNRLSFISDAALNIVSQLLRLRKCIEMLAILESICDFNKNVQSADRV